MGRCKKQRNIRQSVECTLFKPVGINRKSIPEVELMLDELEAISLADVGGLCMKQAAQKMGISAPTFCRILESARRKTGIAIVAGYVIKICQCQKK